MCPEGRAGRGSDRPGEAYPYRRMPIIITAISDIPNRQLSFHTPNRDDMLRGKCRECPKNRNTIHHSDKSSADLVVNSLIICKVAP